MGKKIWQGSRELQNRSEEKVQRDRAPDDGNDIPHGSRVHFEPVGTEEPGGFSKVSRLVNLLEIV